MRTSGQKRPWTGVVPDRSAAIFSEHLLKGAQLGMSRKIEMINVWAQIITGIAVIAGLGLVVWELQITRQASVDMYALITVSDGSADISSMYGEQGAEVMAKACFEPSSLSNAELFIVSKYFDNRVNRIYQNMWQSNFNGDEGWKQISQGWLKEILSFPQGETYVQRVIDTRGEVQMNQLFKDVIAEGNYGTCSEWISQLRVEG
jgi:hypothetical protein